MNPPLDIFQMVPVDRVLWRGTAGSVGEARALIREFAGRWPGKYLVLCVQTGTGLVVHTDDLDFTVPADCGDSAPTENKLGC